MSKGDRDDEEDSLDLFLVWNDSEWVEVLVIEEDGSLIVLVGGDKKYELQEGLNLPKSSMSGLDRFFLELYREFTAIVAELNWWSILVFKKK
jgi:hypothetical protein